MTNACRNAFRTPQVQRSATRPSLAGAREPLPSTVYLLTKRQVVGLRTASGPQALTIDALPERIASKIEVDDDGCWLWLASLGRGGYGQLWSPERKTMDRAHRAIYLLLVGPVDADLEMDHLCRVRRCVNPEHLEPVTRQENQRRRRKYANAAERHAAWRARRREERRLAEVATGWWVSI